MFRHREAGFDLISFWSFLLVVSPPHTLTMKYSKDKIVDQVVKKIIKRDLQGQKKFPKTMCKNNKSVILWIDDAIEEETPPHRRGKAETGLEELFGANDGKKVSKEENKLPF